ncbi:unnamed protein product [Adineta steineri]|uniref:Uncharacterized protein n=1 Tax=Adineta steineri TaxID=433720 RepID=A0A814GLH5_9BILA|nr:unnamed protein product [Adineta steineri]
MVNNTTSALNQYICETVNNDCIGAIIFIIVVLLWYSSSIVFLLGMQIGTSRETLDNSTKGPTKNFVRSLRDQSNNTEILKELVDKQKRDKLWDIYLGTKENVADRIAHAETVRIRNIEKQLSLRNEDSRDSFQRTLDDSYTRYTNSNLWVSDTDLSSQSSRLRTRRRSSSDHKILEEWQILANKFKTHENWPWTIRKLFIRRQLRRQRYTSECGSAP